VTTRLVNTEYWYVDYDVALAHAVQTYKEITHKGTQNLFISIINLIEISHVAGEKAIDWIPKNQEAQVVRSCSQFINTIKCQTILCRQNASEFVPRQHWLSPSSVSSLSTFNTKYKKWSQLRRKATSLPRSVVASSTENRSGFPSPSSGVPNWL
jgi:hypothetical protein